MLRQKECVRIPPGLLPACHWSHHLPPPWGEGVWEGMKGPHVSILSLAPLAEGLMNETLCDKFSMCTRAHHARLSTTMFFVHCLLHFAINVRILGNIVFQRFKQKYSIERIIPKELQYCSSNSRQKVALLAFPTSGYLLWPCLFFMFNLC